LDACQSCFDSSNCHVVDNPCNDDTSCDPKENKWSGCICVADGNGTASAQCDADFVAVNATEAQPIIDCVKQACPVCYQKGPDMQTAPAACTVAHADCRACGKASCSDEEGACSANSTCKAANSALGSCICVAQMGSGTIDACVTTFTTAGGAPATTFANCVKSHCATECGL
jgi:hypothetical protein